MLIPTHKIISEHIDHHIQKSLKVKLNKHMLAYGNMKPDIAPRLKRKKHYKDPTFDFVLDEIISLIDDGLSENLISINKFSTRLGVITHFLCDFFCLPHHDRDYFSDKLMEHMIYEKRLHDHFKSFSGIDKIKAPYIRNISKEDIKNFIEELHQEYQVAPRGFQTDMNHSVNVSSAVGILIVEHSLLYSAAWEGAH